MLIANVGGARQEMTSLAKYHWPEEDLCSHFQKAPRMILGMAFDANEVCQGFCLGGVVTLDEIRRAPNGGGWFLS